MSRRKRQPRRGSWIAGDRGTLERIEAHAVLTHELLDATGARDMAEAVDIVRRWARERRCAAN